MQLSIENQDTDDYLIWDVSLPDVCTDADGNPVPLDGTVLRFREKYDRLNNDKTWRRIGRVTTNGSQRDMTLKEFNGKRCIEKPGRISLTDKSSGVGLFLPRVTNNPYVRGGCWWFVVFQWMAGASTPTTSITAPDNNRNAVITCGYANGNNTMQMMITELYNHSSTVRPEINVYYINSTGQTTPFTFNSGLTLFGLNTTHVLAMRVHKTSGDLFKTWYRSATLTGTMWSSPTVNAPNPNTFPGVTIGMGAFQDENWSSLNNTAANLWSGSMRIFEIQCYYGSTELTDAQVAARGNALYSKWA